MGKRRMRCVEANDGTFVMFFTRGIGEELKTHDWTEHARLLSDSYFDRFGNVHAVTFDNARGWVYVL